MCAFSPGAPPRVMLCRTPWATGRARNAVPMPRYSLPRSLTKDQSGRGPAAAERRVDHCTGVGGTMTGEYRRCQMGSCCGTRSQNASWCTIIQSSANAGFKCNLRYDGEETEAATRSRGRTGGLGLAEEVDRLKLLSIDHSINVQHSIQVIDFVLNNPAGESFECFS